MEARSIHGFSGSPEYVFFNPLFRVGNEGEMSNPKYPILLLGIDWGHLPTKPQLVVDAIGNPHPDGGRFQQNSGVMGVVPAWHILDLLNAAELAEHRVPG